VILSIHQPSYFPWLGLLDKVQKSDVFMLMDETQLSDSAFQHRNLFLAAGGTPKFLTIPIVRRRYLERSYREIEIADDDWRTRHLAFLRNSYGKHAFSSEVMPFLEQYFAADFRLLADAVLASMRLTFDFFDIRTKVIKQSDLRYNRALKRGELVVALARAAGADCYLSGSGGRAYLNEGAFRDDLSLQYNEFVHPSYPQKGVGEFVPGLASLDVLFNVGIAGARALLRQSDHAG
jgi:hypothetical protein